jgi:hypothetical protein
VPMGRATVTADGAFLITDAGSGLTKAGWGGLCRYDECKTALTKCPDCQKLEMRGSPPCPECVVDPSSNDRLGTFGQKISLDSNPLNLLRRYLVPLGAFLEAKGSLAFGYSGELMCCATGPFGRGAKAEGSAAGEFELAISLPLLPVLKKFSTFIFGNADVGPSIVGKFGFSGGGSGSYDWCLDKGSATGKVSAAFEAALSGGGGQFPARLPNGGSATGEVRPLDVGIVGQYEMSFKGWNSSGLALERKLSLDLFAKSQFSIGSLGFTLLDIRAPLISDINRDISFEISRPF